MSDPSDGDARRVLDLLRERHNVLISGPPACGKTRLLSHLQQAFTNTGAPAYDEQNPIPIPATGHSVAAWLPSPTRTDRKVFATVLDQGTRTNALIRTIVPDLTGNHSTGVQFRVASGALYEAAEHALTANGASLLIIDEINRGPAVAAFGPSLVALESDKRLDPDGQKAELTQTFRVLGDDGHDHDFALPAHLYVVAAMNMVDTSVAPLDVAFLRRWAPYRLTAKPEPALSHLGLTGVDTNAALPDVPADAADVYRALVQAWLATNDRIRLARGDAYAIGHGVLMTQAPPTDLPASLDYAAQAWALIRQHIDELFFGNALAIGTMLAADVPGSGYTLVETSFAGQPVTQVRGATPLDMNSVYGTLKAIASQPVQ